MRTDMPAEIWLDPYRWEALQEILEQDGNGVLLKTKAPGGMDAARCLPF